MGREIRRVPPDWEHPRSSQGGYIPLYDKDFDTAAKKWEAEYDLWRKGEHPDQADYYFWEYDSPPDAESCRERSWTPEEATAYQIYETVSEGTPVSPVFPTKDDMRLWLLKQGYSEPTANAFIEGGWVPSFVAFNSNKGVQFYSGIEAAGIMAGDTEQTK